MKLVVFLLMSLGFCLKIVAQDLDEYRWRNRILLLHANNESNSEYQKQLNHLLKNKEGLEERKIIVFHFFKTHYRKGLNNKTNHTYDNNLHTPVEEKHSYTIQLIGLDGGVKYTSNNITLYKKIQSLIDKMPMRQLEVNEHLRRNNKQK